VLAKMMIINEFTYLNIMKQALIMDGTSVHADHYSGLYRL